MNAMLLVCSLMLSFVPAAAAGDRLPGAAFSQPAAGTVLRAGAGADFPGVLTLDGVTVVRTGELRGTFREVFVPQGFTAYMHTDFLDVSPSDATVAVKGERVNLRLLPSADGLLPITQLSQGAGPLVLLDRVNDEWARVLAPVEVALYAPEGVLTASADATAAQARWNELMAVREQQRQAAMAGWRATDPEWQHESALLAEAEVLADVDVSTLDANARAARRGRIADLRSSAKWERTRTILENLRQELDAADALTTSAGRATDVVRQDARTQPAAPTQPVATLDSDALKKESRMLGLGFRFAGKGEAVQRAGSVHKEGSDTSPVYTLHSSGGEILKLTAPEGVATLQALVGKHVELDGRRLFLTTVAGPVLVIDKVVSYRPL